MQHSVEISSASVALIISEENPKKILLAQRNQPSKPLKHGKWHLPGGSIDKSETPEQALRRELREELGWHEFSIANQVVVEQPNDDFSNKQTLYYLYLVITPLTKKIDISQDEDSSAVNWFTTSEIDQLPVFPLVSKAINLFKV